jgi:hypothetical protein
VLKALNSNMTRYEAKFGPIKPPELTTDDSSGHNERVQENMNP